ncbi:uncharacterized protein LOC116257041 isoform X2 [Nymphaea colorata]|uniref:uncharacterized protein LOC116257041 isoform X2 n=1 Tax=Nymphaea colorata TaxID=210225 RepID=UPI00129D5278|nr:uncharacterized protein LOC116257041 isoform X2 [Nymphaea colorata]
MAACANLGRKPPFLIPIHEELGRRSILPACLLLRKPRRPKTRVKTLAFLRPTDVLDSIEKYAHGVLSDTLLSAISSLSMDSIFLMAPALGFISGAALYLSRREKNVPGAGEWILITSPTPFNRFVLLRCPSILFEDGKNMLGELNEKLLKEESHFVKLDGMISEEDLISGELRRYDQDITYQRLCLRTPDGGVISLDWPADLDLRKEKGMDTTVLIIPGTTEGSSDKSVCSFVKQSIRHGLFPVVINPRGCAGSPVTTPRLFTAADSDDICTAVQFISRSRTWSTLLAVGWGYGANMLIKYLSEVSERSAITAVACINTPFDLEDATRSAPSHIIPDQKFTEGLQDILRANKELFQGRGKGFNVEEALSATSVRDFDKAISMVSYGFDRIEDFYKKSSTRELINTLKIPVLFIQTDEGTVPLFSVPRNAIAENPYTSLLLCSCTPSSLMKKAAPSTLPWCQNLIIDWFTGVELAFLKGRHPLLNETDIALSLSKGGAGNGRFNSEHLLESELRGRINLEGTEPQQVGVDHLLQHVESVDDKAVQERQDDVPGATQMSQILQTAEFVMKMLDVTMPGTLGDEQKKKVLAAVGQGETLLKALQEAVPENVRGKVTAAVYELAQTKATKLNIADLINLKWVPNLSGQIKSKVAGRIKEFSCKNGELNANQSRDSINSLVNTEEKSLQMHSSGENNLDLKADPSVFSLNHESPMVVDGDFIGKGTAGMRPVSSEILHSQLHETKSSKSKIDGSSRNNMVSSEAANPSGSMRNDSDLLEKKVICTSANGDSDKEIIREEITEKNSAGRSQEADSMMHKGNSFVTVIKGDSQENNVTEKDSELENLSPSERDEHNSLVKDNILTKEAYDVEKNSDKYVQSSGNGNKETSSKKAQDPLPSVLIPPDPPSVGGVSQALEALTGFDDSTQIAVNSVFGVIENVIEQLERNGNEGGDRTKENEIQESENLSIDKPSSVQKENGDDVSAEDLDIIQSHQEVNMTPNSSQLESASCQSEVTGSLNLSLQENCKSVKDNTVGINELDDQPNTETTYSEKKESNRLNNGFSNYGSFIKKQSNGDIVKGFPLHIILNPFSESCIRWSTPSRSLSSPKQNMSLDLVSTSDLLLEYFPDEGQWKLFDDLEENDCSPAKGDRQGNIQEFLGAPDVNVEKVVEPSYVILDENNKCESSYECQSSKHCADISNCGEESKLSNKQVDNLATMVKNIVINALEVEVIRKLGIPDKDAMKSGIRHEMELIAGVVSFVAKHDILEGQNSKTQPKDVVPAKLGTLNGENIMVAISTAAKTTCHLQSILPIGIIVGSSLASLGESFHVATGDDNKGSNHIDYKSVIEKPEHCKQQDPNVGQDHEASEKFQDKTNNSVDETVVVKNLDGESVMVGAVTAALGATAILAHKQAQRPLQRHGIDGSSSFGRSSVGDLEKEENKLEGRLHDGSKNNIVNTLAEKAISMASPMVPIKDDGGVDQDRLVAILADLGQRGGFLRTIGKVALLWGGIRGAMSLTDRLISFLRIAQRPLFHRLVASACMVLVLWSPVVIPLLPTLLQRWAACSSAGIVEYCCTIGLYVSLMILVMLWGKRIRGYEDPVTQYGLELGSRYELHNMLKGFAGGIVLVMLIHVLNSFLGYASFDLPQNPLFSSTSIGGKLKAFGELFIIVVRGIVTSVSSAVVEELIFRSWLPEEIAADLGYRKAVILSGLGFAIFQWSLPLIPGHWLLSLALSAIKERANGSLAAVIGVRAGITSTAFITRSGGFIKYNQFTPFWIAGAHLWHPFGGVLGVGLIATVAVFFHPKQFSSRNKIP